jgi:hypothetical protein
MKMATVDDFVVGDRVRHIGRNEEGYVHAIERDGVHVHFDQPTPRLNVSVGIFDNIWFKSHPDFLINLSKNEILTERRRAGKRLTQQTPGSMT